MKNRLDILFDSRKKNILSVYFTAGFPKINDTVKIIGELEKSGVDMIEIGIPFSDPLADGPVIQKSSETALTNGMNLELLFAQLGEIKINMPILLMGYLNPVMQFGIEKFCKKCSEKGISGTIIPDMPVEEFRKKYKNIFKKYGLKNIFLITPQTSELRIRWIDSVSDGFIYAVSSASITGNKLPMHRKTRSYFGRLKSMKLTNPVMIGFGISDKKGFRNACKYAHGAIIGSAFIKAIENGIEDKSKIRDFIRGIIK